jgi:glucose/arabinose dehydrogenase
MIYAAQDAASGKLAGALIIAYHGYRKHGHRIVAFPADARGMPTGDSLDVVYGWDRQKSQPMGAPVDIKQAADGAFYITEDRNGTLLRLVQLRR